MRTIWKFSLPTKGGTTTDEPVSVPAGARVVHFGYDARGTLAFWADVDTESPRTSCTFACVATGGDIDGKGDYIGTYTQGPFVWHVFMNRARVWLDHAGGERPDNLPDVNVDILGAGEPDHGEGSYWTGPANVADWSHPCRYRISADQAE